MRRRPLLLLAIAALASCRGGGKAEAEQAVRTYLARLVDAYRTSDASLVDPLMSDAQGLKLVGLIGVKRDAGVVLDAQLLELQFTRVERKGDGWLVETRERWHYLDRKIGTGEQVGPDSTDSYGMRYLFSREDGKFVLEDLTFVGQPVVGRTTAPVPTDPRVFHGLSAAGEPPEPPPVPPYAPGVPPPGHPPVGAPGQGSAAGAPGHAP